MNALYEVQPAGGLPVGYPHDPMFDGLPRQMDLSQTTTRRLSRNSNGQRSGTAMRVTKPSSTNSSPRSSATMRRRTLMNDGNAQRRRQQVLEQMSMYYGSQDEQPSKQRERPVSWHPNSYGQPQPQPQSSYYLSTPAMYVDQQDMYATYSQYSPLMASYSCNTSPSATYSPLALPFHSADSLQYFPTEGKTYTQASSLYPTSTPNQYVPETYLKNDNGAENTSAWDWNAFIMHGFNSTTPPTPEAFPQTQLSQPVLSEESLPYEPLEEAEEEGEILVGMGLYDTPDKYDEDPQLNNYRSTVSSLLGSSFRPQEPKGKGLKLEETWEPPKSEDEEEEDEDEDSSD